MVGDPMIYIEERNVGGGLTPPSGRSISPRIAYLGAGEGEVFEKKSTNLEPLRGFSFDIANMWGGPDRPDRSAGGDRTADGGPAGVQEQEQEQGAGGQEENAKISDRAAQIRPPPPNQKVVSIPRAVAQNGYIAPTLLSSKLLKPFHIFVKTNNMNNSIYNTKYSGLTVRNGRLINEQVGNAMAGITRAAMERKTMKQERKIGMMEEAYVRAEMKTDAIEQLRDMMK